MGAHSGLTTLSMCLLSPSWNGVYSKNRIALKGIVFFSFKVEPFLEGTLFTEKQTEPQELSFL